MIKRRRPQKICKCGHARKNHSHYAVVEMRNIKLPDKWFMCHYCYDKCREFEQDNLATLERLYEHKQNSL